MADNEPMPTVLFNRDEPQWPMSFTLQPPVFDTIFDTAPPRRWWDHAYYRGPEGESVQVLYSKTKSDSEEIAKQFVNEPVLGFDMEWPWPADKQLRLKDTVALIQLASERKVGLFHISLHEGDTVDDLIAPSLKEIIESPGIIKTGVNILRADFGRLRAHFQLEPKGAFELSHLYNLITFGSTTPQMVTTRLRKLSMQVEQHLGLPLWKGDVRTSDWSRPLNWSQTKYAATDAYAGFMLFHCMNAKRLAMNPVPPFPRFHETYVTSPLPRSTLVQLESVTEESGIRIVTAVEFFAPAQNIEGEQGNAESGEGTRATGIAEYREAQENINKPTQRKTKKPRRPKLPATDLTASMNNSCWALYDRLASHRLQMARSKGISAFIIAYNTTLQALSVHRPSNEQELSLVPGIGRVKVAEYGAAWLEIIAQFVADHAQDDDQGAQEPDTELDGPDPKRRRIYHDVGRLEEVLIPPQEPAAVPTTSLPPQLSSTAPASNPPALPQLIKREDPDDYDGDSVFGSPFDLPSSSVLKRKRDDTTPSDPEVQQNAFPIAVQTVVSVVSLPEPPHPVKVEPAPELKPTPKPEPEPVPVPVPTAMVTPAINPGPKPRRAPAPKPVPISTLTRTRALAASRLHPQMPPESLSRERALLKRKLEAYIKSVTRALRPTPTEALGSESMLQYLITTVPRTAEEFRRAPGMQRLLKACETAKMDVWRAFEKWTQNPRVVLGARSSR